MVNKPELMRTPIAIKGTMYRFIEELSDIPDLGDYTNPNNSQHVNISPGSRKEY
ncbi:MAG: hypothetical protein HC880_04655 [Bacteroidia bacterium]|nr:hypothetical protein [Bacteroidia bacterium]